MSSVTRSSVVGVELGYAEITSSYTQTGAGTSDVTGLSVTVTVGARPIVVSFNCQNVYNSAATGLTAIYIKESTTTLQSATVYGSTVAIQIPVAASVRLAPSAGSHTYKISVQQLITGNSIVSAATTGPTSIQVVEV